VSVLGVWFVMVLAMFVTLIFCVILLLLLRGKGEGRSSLTPVILFVLAIPIGLWLLVTIFAVGSYVSEESQTATIVYQDESQNDVSPLPNEFSPVPIPPPVEVSPPAPQTPQPPKVVAPQRERMTPRQQSRTGRPGATPASVQVVVGAETPTNRTGIPAVWQLDESDLFTARIYPSLLATAAPLAGKLADKLLQIQPVDEKGEQLPPAVIQVSGRKLDDKHRSGLLERFTRQLRKELPGAEVLVVSDTDSEHQRSDPKPAMVSVSLEVGTLDQRPAWDDGIDQERGKHFCRAHTSRGDILVECEYIDKPWLEDFDTFVSQRPSKRFVIGYSDSPASSEAEARRLALADAVARSRIKIAPETFVVFDQQHVVDRFAQRLSRPYGHVWREAVLLDVSPERIAPAIAAVQATLAVRQTENRSTIRGLVLLLGFTALLCITLDAISQGYYRKPLVVGIAVVVIFVLLGGFWIWARRESLSTISIADTILIEPRPADGRKIDL